LSGGAGARVRLMIGRRHAWRWAAGNGRAWRALALGVTVLGAKNALSRALSLTSVIR